MRPLGFAVLACALLSAPAWAFSNEFRTGSVSQAHGHGELVRRAAEGTEFEALAEALVQGQRDLDFPGAPRGSVELGLADWWRALVAAIEPGEQKKHFLRWYSGLPEWRAATQPLEADWADAVGYVELELEAAYHAPRGQEAEALGRALHTLQDSYTPAHVARGADGRIRSLAYYPSQGGHQLVDARDRILTESGELTPEARAAVAASHELLLGFARWRTADEAAFGRWVQGFTAQHLAFSGR